VLLRRAAVGYYAAAAMLAVLAFLWPWSAWLAAGAVLVGFWCRRDAILTRHLARRDESGAHPCLIAPLADLAAPQAVGRHELGTGRST
jgi:hypothetical protein